MEVSSPSKSSTPKDPIKYKFFRKVMHIDVYNTDEIEMKLETYMKMKRFYFRKIKTEEYSQIQDKILYASNSRKKQFNYLTDLDFLCSEDSHQFHDRKTVKLLKNLKNVKMNLQWDSSIRPAVLLTKQIPKNIETITITGSYMKASMTDLQNLYRSLRVYRKLKRFEKNLDFQRPDTMLTVEEYNAINKFTTRLRNLEEFCCIEEKDNELGLGRYLSQGQACLSVTSLSVWLSKDILVPDSDEIRIPLLFRFHLFPSLKQLKISVKAGISLDRTVSQGFKSLPQLKHFTLDIGKDVQARKTLFEGLSHLPGLERFRLSVPRIENDEELLLVKFLQKQTYLVSLILLLSGSMPSIQRYQELNQHLEMMCQSINNQPKLKYLHLIVTSGSLQTLSKSLGQAGTTNQLKELKIGALDDLSIPSSIPDSKIKGLCDFIERQKLSLRCLWIMLECIKEDEILDSIIEAIGETNKLDELRFAINLNNMYNSSKFNARVKESLQGCPSFKKAFTNLNKVLPTLKELSSLSLELNPITLPFDAPMINSSVIFNSLPALKNLEWLSLCLPFMEQSINEHPSQIDLLYKTESLMNFGLATSSGREIEELENEELSKVRERIYERAIRRLRAVNLDCKPWE